MRNFMKHPRFETQKKHPWTTVAVAAVLVSAIVAVGRIPCLDASTKANIWVAVGTLGLALITWASLNQTRTVIAAEDRRHQQGYAPLLLLTPTELVGGHFNAAVYNAGQGLAIKVLVVLEGRFSTTQLVNTPPTMALMPMPDRPIPESSTIHHIGVVPTGANAGISFPQEGAEYATASLMRVRIEYADMFGNEYVTIYRAHTINANELYVAAAQAFKFPEAAVKADVDSRPPSQCADLQSYKKITVAGVPRSWLTATTELMTSAVHAEGVAESVLRAVEG
jgi:hypothetical protein